MQEDCVANWSDVNAVSSGHQVFDRLSYGSNVLGLHTACIRLSFTVCTALLGLWSIHTKQSDLLIPYLSSKIS